MCSIYYFLSSFTDGRLLEGDASGVKAMLEELARNKSKIHGWDNNGSVSEGREHYGWARGSVHSNDHGYLLSHFSTYCVYFCLLPIISAPSISKLCTCLLCLAETEKVFTSSCNVH